MRKFYYTLPLRYRMYILYINLRDFTFFRTVSKSGPSRSI